MNDHKESDNGPYYGLSARSHRIRRIWHMTMVFSLSYYLVPETLFVVGSFEFNKTFVILILFSIIAFVEVLRLTGRWTFELYREHERRRISAPFWFTSTTALIILLFPQWFAVPIVLCTTFGDPVIGEFRHRKFRLYESAGVVVCFIPYLLYTYNLPIIAVMAVITTGSEIFANRANESSRLYALGIYDDNFTMQFFPTVVLGAIWFVSLQFGLGLLPPGTEEILKPLF